MKSSPFSRVTSSNQLGPDVDCGVVDEADGLQPAMASNANVLIAILRKDLLLIRQVRPRMSFIFKGKREEIEPPVTPTDKRNGQM
jgi:hypothetical protein